MQTVQDLPIVILKLSGVKAFHVQTLFEQYLNLL